MTEKKATKKATATKPAAKKTATKKVAEVSINAENVGFRAGDVYQALAAAGKAMSVAEIAKAAKISKEETYLLNSKKSFIKIGLISIHASQH